jgi:hypothetical protein
MHGKPQKAPEDLPEAKKRADELRPKKREEEQTP